MAKCDNHCTGLKIFPGVYLYKGFLDRDGQEHLLHEIFARLPKAPFFRPTMPRSGRRFSVEMTNFGSLGWVSDRTKGYRYEACHPVTGKAWPDMPPPVLDVWAELGQYTVPPEACLVNFYKAGARMGLHQDKDEAALDAPVVSISLGETAVFRIGPPARSEQTKTVQLASGDVLTMGGAGRLSRHGVDRIIPASSQLIAQGGRINLTLRRVNEPQ